MSSCQALSPPAPFSNGAGSIKHTKQFQTVQHTQTLQHLPVFVERQHVEVGDIVGVSQLQSSLALGFINEVANVLAHKLALITRVQPLAGLSTATLFFSGQESYKISGHFQDIKTMLSS